MTRPLKILPAMRPVTGVPAARRRGGAASGGAVGKGRGGRAHGSGWGARREQRVEWSWRAGGWADRKRMPKEVAPGARN